MPWVKVKDENPRKGHRQRTVPYLKPRGHFSHTAKAFFTISQTVFIPLSIILSLSLSLSLSLASLGLLNVDVFIFKFSKF